MQLPGSLLQSLQGINGFHEAAFRQVHQSGEQVTSIRINPNKVNEVAKTLPAGEGSVVAIPWCQYGYYLPQRPSFTFDPLFHAGCYYVQEASSMFLEQAIKQHVDLLQPLKILDLCAAPGGKSTHLQSLLSKHSLLVSNEVIRQRVNILKDNIIKWGCGNIVVTNNDPRDFTKLTHYFDVIVVDAPCSGSGLFRRDPEAIAQWSESNVMLCSQRQQRILADVLPALKPGGVLIYSTCSYSKTEDEDIADWLCDAFSLSSMQLSVKETWGVTQTVTTKRHYGYRFWPYNLKGEGFFIAAFRKEGNGTGTTLNIKSTIKPVTKKLLPLVAKYINATGQELVAINDKIYAWPGTQFADFNLLAQQLRVIYSGTLIGQLAHDKLVPDHALAMSNIAGNDIAKAHLDISSSIKYLQKKAFDITGLNKGWQLATYNNHPLGWMNVLPNRINNYYPNELRILKEQAAG